MLLEDGAIPRKSQEPIGKEERVMKLAIRIARQPGMGYQAWCPALPGCKVFAETRDQVCTRIRNAIGAYLANVDVVLPRELARRSRMPVPSRLAHSRFGPHAPGPTR